MDEIIDLDAHGGNRRDISPPCSSVVIRRLIRTTTTRMGENKNKNDGKHAIDSSQNCVQVDGYDLKTKSLIGT